jgi:hypothetical protein
MIIEQKAQERDASKVANSYADGNIIKKTVITSIEFTERAAGLFQQLSAAYIHKLHCIHSE